MDTNMNNEYGHSVERIEKARVAFTKMCDIFGSHDLSVTTSLITYYVFTALYTVLKGIYEKTRNF